MSLTTEEKERIDYLAASVQAKTDALDWRYRYALAQARARLDFHEMDWKADDKLDDLVHRLDRHSIAADLIEFRAKAVLTAAVEIRQQSPQATNKECVGIACDMLAEAVKLLEEEQCT